MAVITITRQFGAGGSRVGELAAARLGWTLIDNEFVDRVAAQAGLPPETVAAKEERAPTLMERLVRALATASPETYVPAAAPLDEPHQERIVRVTEHVIAEAAEAGRVVLVGRGAQFVLGQAHREDTLHVYVVAPREVRARTIMEREGLEEAAASNRLDQVDAARDRYVKRWYDRDRQNPANYHLVVNTGWLGCEGAADLVADLAHRRGW